MDKFEKLTAIHSDGDWKEWLNDLFEDKLLEWDKKYGLEVSEEEIGRFALAFKNVTQEQGADLADEVYEFCPDIVDQGVGCLDEMVEMYEESGQELPENIRVLTEGIDFEDDDFGIRILEKALILGEKINFWWD